MTPPRSGLRTLGAPPVRRATARPRRGKAAEDLARRVRTALAAEFRRAIAIKATLAAEAEAHSGGKGREAKRTETLRSLVASLEGMSRLAIALGLLTAAEERAIWARYIRKGLFEGWR